MVTLKQKVHAINEANRISNEVVNFIIPRMKELVGQKVVNKDESIPAKAKIEFPVVNPVGLDGGYCNMHRMRIDYSYRSVWLRLSICCKESDHTCLYEDADVYLGELDGQVISSIS